MTESSISPVNARIARQYHEIAFHGTEVYLCSMVFVKKINTTRCEPVLINILFPSRKPSVFSVLYLQGVIGQIKLFGVSDLKIIYPCALQLSLFF